VIKNKREALMWYNGIIKWWLRSPFHRSISSNMMLITYIGRKSGKQYAPPVNYLRIENDDGVTFLTSSLRNRTWWRNLRGGAPVTIRLQGKDHIATAEVIEDDEGVAENLMIYLSKLPDTARFFQVNLDTNRQPVPADVALAAQTRVIIQTQLV
jgi:deazaflavin-dependent oxidoreductase (nitroreductase family)